MGEEDFGVMSLNLISDVEKGVPMLHISLNSVSFMLAQSHSNVVDQNNIESTEDISRRQFRTSCEIFIAVVTLN